MQLVSLIKTARNIKFQRMKSVDTMSSKVQQHLDSITTYLTPLLPLINCHMVEFFTENHWETLLPKELRCSLEELELSDAVNQFWKAVENKSVTDPNCPIMKWVNNARSHYLHINNDYCISTQHLQELIKKWGGEVKPEIKIGEFMTSKKSYEVQTMSSLIASLHDATKSTCCIEVGGGRGHLPVALSLGYNVPSLTIDCDEKTVKNAAERVKIIQKQWHVIAKRIKDGNEERMTQCIDKNLHRFASSYVTKDTDLRGIVKDTFPDICDGDIKVLLTGLHTCGNLGPDSLRIFSNQSSTSAVFNVPCCYHLLTEDVDAGLFDVFQRDYRCANGENGFPMSEYLRGYNLGRNARMLAAQSIDRVTHLKQMPSKSLFYRALLQVIVKQHLPNYSLLEGKLKRMNSKCDSFQQYFKAADAILNLNLFDSLSDSFYTDIEENFSCQWKKLVLFYLLRLCLAQVIESVILLDRLKYLIEQGFNNVYLVKLFDPILSPRCHSIVAVR